MRYVDGFLLPVPKKNIAAYRRIAAKAGKVWMKYGALAYIEAVGEDVSRQKGWEGPEFPKLAGCKPTDTVIFSFIIFKSRKHRDQVNKKVMKDPFMNNPKMKESLMPFDVKKMAYGGFKAIVDL